MAPGVREQRGVTGRRLEGKSRLFIVAFVIFHSVTEARRNGPFHVSARLGHTVPGGLAKRRPGCPWMRRTFESIG